MENETDKCRFKLNISPQSKWFGIKIFLQQILQAFSTTEMQEIMCNRPHNVTAIATTFIAKHFNESTCKSKTKASIEGILKKFSIPFSVGTRNKNMSVQITLGLSLVTVN